MKNSNVLQDPFLPHLQSEAVYNYRVQYNNYRIGFARGARGEIEDVSDEIKNEDYKIVDSEVGMVDDKHIINFAPKSSASCGLSDEFKYITTNSQESYFENDLKIFQRLSEWRFQYMKFRQGYPRGASGDVEVLASHLKREHLSFLPVCQLKELLIKQKVEKSIKKEEKKKVNFHIHIGAGKLGLGLVLPAILKSNIRFAIYQKFSDPWTYLVSKDDLESDEDIDISVQINEVICCNLRIFKPKIHKLEDLFSNKINDPRSPLQSGWLIMDFDGKIDSQIFKVADTFSSSVGPNIPLLYDLFSTLSSNDGTKSRPVLFACENDHKSVYELAKKISNKLEIIICMVDRICSSRHILSKKVKVITEPYEGEIVPLSVSENLSLICPLSGENVRISKLIVEAQYFSKRKLLLVNGMHTTLAFVTLCENISTHSSEEQTPLGNYKLLNPEEASEKIQRHIWGWAVARILLLLFEHDINIIKDAHNVKEDEEVVTILLDYAKKTIHRFSTVEDTTDRVLSGGIVNRFNTRLKNVKDFMDAEGPFSVSAGNLLLRKAGFGVCELGFIVFSLVEKAMIFIDMDNKRNTSSDVMMSEYNNRKMNYKFKSGIGIPGI